MIAVAFTKEVPATLPLPMASCLGIGGYRLIRIHTTRVWRIVGYMRCALKRHLYGIRWETRLFRRHKFLAGEAPRLKMGSQLLGFLRGDKPSIDHHLDRDIFDGHVWILDLVNMAIALLILAVNLLQRGVEFDVKTGWLPRLDQHWVEWSFILSLQLVLPAGALIRSQWAQRSFRRGEGEEENHVRSWWDEDAESVRAAEAEPPHDFPRKDLNTKPIIWFVRIFRKWFVRFFPGNPNQRRSDGEAI